MPKARPLLPFPEVCRAAWRDCAALWPLFLALLVIYVLQYVTLFFCALVLFLPLFSRFGPTFGNDPSQWDPAVLLEELGRSMTDPSWFFPFLGILTLYATWWGLLSAVADGAIFKAFWRRSTEDQGVSFSRFFKDGLELFLPMVVLDLYLFFLGTLLSLPALIGLGALGLGVMSLGSGHGWGILALGFLFGLPLALGGVVLFAAFFAFSFTATACVARGAGPREGLKEAWVACRADGGRSLKGILLVLLVYFVVSACASMVFNGLSLIPSLGWIFSLADILTGVLFALLFGVFTPALAVRYLSEEGRGR